VVLVRRPWSYTDPLRNLDETDVAAVENFQHWFGAWPQDRDSNGQLQIEEVRPISLQLTCGSADGVSIAD